MSTIPRRVSVQYLNEGKVAVNSKSGEYYGHLIDNALQDSLEPTYSCHWVYRLNPRLVALFKPNRYKLSNWRTRQELSQDLVRWLESHGASS